MKKHKGSMISYLNKATQAAKTSRDYIIKEIEVSKIIRNEKNFYSIEGIEEMANSLAVSRHIPPLEVIDNKDGTYRLISGERRLSATLLRIERGELDEEEKLPCHVLPDFEEDKTLTKEQQETLAVILANNYRDKTPLDKLKEIEALEPIARVMYDAEKEKGNLLEDGKNPSFRAFFAEHILNISEASLRRLKDLSKLTEKARQAFEDGRIGKSVAEKLAAHREDFQDYFIHVININPLQGSLADMHSLYLSWREELKWREEESSKTHQVANEVDQEDVIDNTPHFYLEDREQAVFPAIERHEEEELERRGQTSLPTMEREKTESPEETPTDDEREELSIRSASTHPSAPPTTGNSVTEEERQSNRWIVDMLGLEKQLQDLLSMVKKGMEQEKDSVQLAELRVREACINLWIERYC